MSGTIEQTRHELHEWIEDLEALRPFTDPGNPDAEAFVAAWTAALVKAKEAAARYAEAVSA